MQKEQAGEIFGVSKKNVANFTMETPEKRVVEGFICKSHGSMMGSMIINTVDSKETLQFVRGMPKLQYYDNRTAFECPQVFEKADGTNVTMYPLIIDGDCVEVLFKTRQTTQLQNKFMKRVELAIENNHYDAVEKYKKSFSYELYGYENQHDVVNYHALDIPIGFDLLTILEQGMSLPVTDFTRIANDIGLNISKRQLTWMTNHQGTILANFTPYFRAMYGEWMPELKQEELEFTSFADMYDYLAMFYEKMNMNYQQNSNLGGNIIEGSVFHDGSEENLMYKCKAISVKAGHKRQAIGIEPTDISHAIIKATEFFDNEYEIGIDGLWESKQIKPIIEFIKEELYEEYPKKIVDHERAYSRIHSQLSRKFQKCIIPSEIKEIAQKIKDANPEADNSDLMRVFAQEYPDNKKMSSKMYQAFAKL